MTDNIAPDITNYQNTNFMEQRVLDTQTAFPNSLLPMPSTVSDEMADGMWSVKHQLMKPILVRQAQWTTANARGDRIIEFSFPSILATESLIRDTLSIYSFYKMSPCFRIQINATQFNAGQLICTFDPFTISSAVTPNAYEFDSYNVFSATGFPHVRIMASESDPVELKVPFIHPRNYLTTNVNTFDNLGYFRVSVLNPLTAANGSSSNVTVSVWIYAADSEVHVPINIHAPVLEATSFIGQSLLKPLSNLAGETSQKLGNIVTHNVGQALKMVGGLVMPNLPKLDYPSLTLSTEKTIIPVENLAVGIGKSRSQRLALDPFSMNPLPDDIAGETYESMDLHAIVQKPFLLTQAMFKTTDAVGSALFNFVVHPSLSPYLSLTDTYGIRQHNYLSYVTNAFLYWSGGICFDIEIVATRFHVGKLLIAYVPSDQEMPSYAQASTALPNVIIDIQQTSHFTFIVPWTSSTSMKSCYLNNTTTQSAFSDSINGNLVCYVLNALNAPSNVASNIELNVYMYAAPDFNLYVPARPISNTGELPTPTVEATSGISIEADSNQPHKTTVYLTKDQGLSKPRPHFGESYNMFDLIKRFSYDSSSIQTTPENGLITVAPDTKLRPLRSLSILYYFSRIYSCWMGSIRYKIAYRTNRSSNVVATVTHFPDIGAFAFLEFSGLSIDTISQFYGSARTHLSQDSAIEFETPYYSKYNMLITRDTSNTVSIPDEYLNNGVVTVSHQQLPDGTELSNYDLYIAAGEDFRFIYLRPPPIDVFAAGVGTVQPMYNE